ncbi:MerR family transcriptional regulator [Nocardia terpenica]|uniref:MerR family transcriptional regulator n=1 Tax=Nocardia terpenica TaxID=455432 RepID=A0A164I7B9_9NOCA|nr:MerR family transcriptional regulator [Nocardia terpenica]KZM69167.1 MerR family transcriptional regulator [Nocardia terpenica]NQE87712.1 MerR family transcriptional regulator [Nocardia terpenica]
MAAGAEFTIDELAREAGTTVRSLRVYHERGVLPPPQVKGRTGFYGPEHLNRVRTISRLLDRGIKLNGIRELLQAWDRGDDLGDILGVGEPGEIAAADPAAASPAPDRAVPSPPEYSETTVAATELAQRYREVPNGLARVIAAGLYEPVDAATYRVVDPQLVGLAERLAAAGAPPAQVLDELDRLVADCDRIARRFVDVFERTAWQEFRQSPGGADDLALLTARVTDALAVPGRVSAELVDRFVARYLERDIAELGDLLRER